MANDTEQNIQQSIEETSSPEQVVALQQQVRSGSIYKLDPKSKVPVSVHEGNVWKGRKTGGIKRMKWIFESWSEAEAYYAAGQMDHRKATGGITKGNDVVSKNRNRKFSSTDNQVYATVNAVIPSIYAKNPEVEITMNRKDFEQFNSPLKRFGNNLIARKDTPGINLKPKARKGIMRCEVTNEAWVMVGYNRREDSADAAREDIARIGKELMEAKGEEDIKRLEGELMALEEQCDLLDPAGPFVKSIRGDQVIIDDASVEDDHSDANWMMVCVYLPTAYLNARYRQKDEAGNPVSAYKATHIVDAKDVGDSVSDVQREIDTFHIFSQGNDQPKAYGYDDKNAYERAKMTQCWYGFDKVKRRFYLYAENDWTYPIWCYDDPYHFPMFFPLFKLQYHTDPRLTRTKGEVSHYLDQQDSINVIEDELNRARTTLQDRYWADSSIDQHKIEELMLSTERKVVSFRVPEGKKLADLIMSPPLPALQYQHLWDKAPALQSINMISGVMDAQRGEQFRTNTTNKAIEQYSSNSNVRLDEKRDAIEDWIGEITWAVIFLCLQFMPMEEIAEIAGENPQDSAFAQMRNMDPNELRRLFTCRCVGGSTQKATSAAKKAEALQVGQVIGQFGAVPYAQLLAVKNLARAFDGMTITEDDWQMLLQTMMMGLQQAGAGPGGQQPGSPEEENAEGEPAQQGPTEEEMVKEVIARAKAQGKTVTPMQAKMALQRRAQNGAPH